MWLQIIASIFIIYLGHLSWNYLKNRFSKEKNRDLVQIQTRKYQKIIEEMQENTHSTAILCNTGVDPENLSNTESFQISIDPLMQEDLESFMNEINN